jgi:hypothetical protein
MDVFPLPVTQHRRPFGRPNRSMLTRAAAIALLIPLLAACGSTTASTNPSTSAPPSSSAAASGAATAVPTVAPSAAATASAAPTAAGDIQLLACQPTGPAFPVAALEGAAGTEQADNPAAAALRQFLGGPDGADLPANQWRELVRTKSQVLYGHDDPGGEADVIVMARAQLANSEWTIADSGQCHLRTWYANAYGIAADWKLSGKVAASATSFRALVTEFACASGKSASGRIGKPRIAYTNESVTITIGVRPLQGTQDCPGNPATPLTVRLSEPLGTRTLFNGGPYPAVEVKQPR